MEENQEEQQAQQAVVGQYQIKVSRDKTSWEVEVTGPDQKFVTQEVDRLLALFNTAPEKVDSNIFDVEASNEPPTVKQMRVAQVQLDKPDTLNEFVGDVNFVTNLDRILTYGYWCEIKQGKGSFTSDDLITKFKEAKEKPPANIKRDLGSLQSRGVLMPPSKNQEGLLEYQLSKKGMKEVETLLGIS